MTFLIIISGRKEKEGKDAASDYDRKVTIPDEFVHECQSFIFFFFFFFYPASFVPFSWGYYSFRSVHLQITKMYSLREESNFNLLSISH